MKPNKASNSLLLDPTRTVMLRKRFAADMRRRFAKFISELTALIVTEDAFGIEYRSRIAGAYGDPAGTAAVYLTYADTRSVYTANSRWAYLTTPEQLSQFQRWLEAQIAHDILQSSALDPASALWVRKYISQAYLKGQARAFDDVMKPALWTGISPQTSAMQSYAGTKLQFMNNPISQERLGLLVARTQAELKGATDAMSQQLSRELMDGLALNLSTKAVLTAAADRVRRVGLTRALTTVDSEVVRSHSEGVLDALEALGLSEVSVMVEWTTGSNPCKVCQALRGVVLPITKARGLFPRHPRCRCSPVPANRQGSREQIRGKRKVQAALHRSIRAEYPQRSLSKAKAKSRWASNI